MGLGDKLKELFFDVADVLTSPVRWGIQWGVESFIDAIAPNVRSDIKKAIEESSKMTHSPSLNELREQLKNGSFTSPPPGDDVSTEKLAAEDASIIASSILGGFVPVLGSLIAAFGTIYQAGLGELYAHLARQLYTPARLNPSEAITLYFHMVKDLEDTKKELSDLGYTGSRVDYLINVMRPLLSPDTVRQLYLRGEEDAGFLEAELAAAGWEPRRIRTLEKLYQIIPGVQDLTRMAVREAFSPEIVAKFQTDADFPPEFAEWAAKQGLSAEWAKNYWRAHWDLPSATQGFEMLHRGIIDEEEVKILLRTLDVMPYWRDRLIQMTYSIPTRVDIRRIFNLGIRDRAWVKAQYIKLGYAEDDAEALTEFTTRLATSEDKDLTKTEVLSLYKKGVIDEDATREYLADMEYSEEDVEYLLAVASTETAVATAELSLSQIKSLALAGLIDRAEATKRMAELGYTADDITKLYELWTLEAPPQDTKPSRTDLARFYQGGIITLDQWIDGMYALRYSEEVIPWYFQEMTKSS